MPSVRRMGMAIRINKPEAVALMRASSLVQSEALDLEWVKKVETLSRLCEQSNIKTHIAFLGTAMIAKAMDPRVDLFAIKPDHAVDNPNAFSARTLCHGVLVPMAAELGINIGATGREPLNNQPYFRMTHLNDGTPIQEASRPAFEYLIKLVQELQDLNDSEEPRKALQAFIAIRRSRQIRYADPGVGNGISPEGLLAAIQTLVSENSEHGRRAQAVVAGLMDAFAGTARVESGRINDPSRHYPGDVCVRSGDSTGSIEKAFEVRDKPVTATDVQIFGKKCVDMGVREAALVMVSGRQPVLDRDELSHWASGLGIGLTLFHGWESIVDQALFWAGDAKPLAASRAVGFIRKRLIDVESSIEAVSLWDGLTQ